MNPIGLPESNIEPNNQDDEDRSMIRWAYIKCFAIVGFGIAFSITGSLWLGNSKSDFDNIAGSFGFGFGIFSVILGLSLAVSLYRVINGSES